MLRTLFRTRLLMAVALLLASPAGAQPPPLPQKDLAGPLGKTHAGRLICAARVSVDVLQADVRLTIWNASGAEVATQLFADVAGGSTVEIEVGPGPGGAFTCLSESEVSVVRLTLTHKSALQRATAAVEGADVDLLGATSRSQGRSQAGPIGPGIGFKIVCRGTSAVVDPALTVVVLDQNGNAPPGGQITGAVNAHGILEVAVNAAYGQEYVCSVRGQGTGIVHASIEARSALGEPQAGASDTKSFIAND